MESRRFKSRAFRSEKKDEEKKERKEGKERKRERERKRRREREKEGETKGGETKSARRKRKRVPLEQKRWTRRWRGDACRGAHHLTARPLHSTHPSPFAGRFELGRPTECPRIEYYRS
jgi:hypothetical protein